LFIWHNFVVFKFVLLHTHTHAHMHTHTHTRTHTHTHICQQVIIYFQVGLLSFHAMGYFGILHNMMILSAFLVEKLLLHLMSSYACQENL